MQACTRPGLRSDWRCGGTPWPRLCGGRCPLCRSSSGSSGSSSSSSRSGKCSSSSSSSSSSSGGGGGGGGNWGRQRGRRPSVPASTCRTALQRRHPVCACRQPGSRGSPRGGSRRPASSTCASSSAASAQLPPLIQLALLQPHCTAISRLQTACTCQQASAQISPSTAAAECHHHQVGAGHCRSDCSKGGNQAPHAVHPVRRHNPHRPLVLRMATCPSATTTP
jgi:hypothetical protein